MALLRDTESKQFIEVPDNEAAAKLRSGKFDLTEGKIKVQNPDDGSITDIPTNEAAKFYEAGFITPTKAQEIAAENRAQTEQYRSHFDDELLAGMAGAARGASLGLSDVVLDQAGLGEAAQTLKEVNPIASTVGEVGGAIASSVATGGFGTQKAVASTGELIKDAVTMGQAARGLETAKSTENLLNAIKIVGGGVQGAAEGAIQGAGVGLSDAVLGNHDDVAEKVLLDAYQGAKFGGIFGATGGVLSAYGVPIAEKTIEKGKELFDTSVANTAKMYGNIASKFIPDEKLATSFKSVLNDPEMLENLAKIPPTELKKATAEAAKEFSSYGKEFSDYAKDFGQKVKQFSAQERNTFEEAFKNTKGSMQDAYGAIKMDKDALYSAANDALSAVEGQPARHLGPIIDDYQSLVKKLEQSGLPEAKAMAENMTANLNYVMPDKKVLALKGQALKEALSKQFDEASELRVIRALDEYTGKQAYQTKNLEYGTFKKGYSDLQKSISNVYDNVSDPTVGQAFKDADARNKLYQKIGSALFDSSGEVKTRLSNPKNFESLDTIFNSISDVAPQFKELSTLASKAKKAEALKQAWSNLTKDAKVDPQVWEQFAKEMGEDISKIKDLSIFNQLQKEFQSNPGMTTFDKLIKVKTALGQSVDKVLEENAKNFTKMEMVQHLYDGSKPYETASIANFLLYKALGTKFAAPIVATAKVASNPYGYLLGTSKLLSTVDKTTTVISKAAKNIVNFVDSPKTVSLGISTNRSSSKEDLKKAENAITLLNDPQTFQEVMSSKTALLQANPNVQMAINNQMSKTVQFLKGKMPQSIEPALGGKKVPVSDYEMRQWSRYLNAVEDPLGTVNRIAQGRGTPEETETLKTIYPNVFQKLQDSVMDAIVEKGSELPYSKRIALSQMFDLNLDPTLNADFIQKAQSMFAEAPQGGQGRPQGSTDAKPRFRRKLDQYYASDLQKLTNEELN